MVLAGAIGSGTRTTRRRRGRRGPRSSDLALAWALSPWHLLKAAAAGALAVVAGALAGGTLWLVAWALITGTPLGRATADGPVEGAVTAGAVAVAIAAAWLAPSSGLLREGGREALAVLLPGRGSRTAVVLLGLVVVLAAAVPAVLGMTTPDWSPLPSPVR
jgi:hypothetical protein